VNNIIFDSLNDAKIWIGKNQENRRNLTDFQRVEIALKLKDLIASKAKERQRAAGGDRKSENAKSLPQNSAEAISNKETRHELAEIADVSHDTLNRVEYILEHADDETKAKLRRGEKGTSINKEYNRLKKQSAPKEEKSVTTSDVTETKESVANSEVSEPVKETKYFPKTTLRLIPQESPHALLVNLFEIFRKGYVEEMIVMALEMLDDNRGKGSVKAMMSQLNKKFGKK
jgi:hypothetical protein